MVIGGAYVPSAHAQGGRLEATRSAVRPSPPPRPRPSASYQSQPPRRTPATRRTRVYVRTGPSTTTRTRVTTYYIPRQTPPSAVPPPQALGPQSTQPDLEKPPPRPPFKRFANRYPYEARRSGWVVDPWEGNDEEHRRISGRASLEGAYLYRGLWRSGFAARIGSPRVDVDTQMSFYYEPAAQDALYLGDTTLNFAPVALPGIVWRVGLGARYMADARLPGSGPREYAAGWNFSTSLDAFPGKPFVISARLDRGMLYQSPVWRARLTAGLVHKRFELFAGYDHTQVERVALGGPLIGLRAWL